MGKLEIGGALATLSENAATLEREMAWAGAMIDAAIRIYFEQPCHVADVRELPVPPVEHDSSRYAALVREHELDADQRFVLILAMLPHLRPQLLDPFLMKNVHYERGFTEFGGVNASHGGFLPTVETAAFVLAGANLARRLALVRVFAPEHGLRRARLIEVDANPAGPGLFCSALRVHEEQVTALTTGCDYQPGFSNSFPAKRLETALDWEDLILPDSVYEAVDEVRAWIAHGPTLMHEWQLAKHIKPGFRTLFYGPPGTGKTLTACLLGKSCGLDVYRVDLSLVVSKYIGETEKNLSAVFDQAENRNWILFFDEADALFGKRGATTSANDRYANQEVAYLLQRVEDFPGVVVLATNLKANIDEAFARRFQSMIYFPMPGVDERLQLWQNAFVQQGRLADGLNLAPLADEFEISGGAISNVLRYAALTALRRGQQSVGMADIRDGVRRELRKEGKIL